MSSSVVSPGPDVAPMAAVETSTEPEIANTTPARPRWRLVALAVASGLLLWLCHFPVAWGWLAWVALVPLLALTRTQARTRWLFCAAWLGGIAYYFPAISWMTVADNRMVACWAMLSTYCSLYFPLTIYIVRRLDQRTGLPLVVTVPAVWTALEYFRSSFGTGFSWYLLGHTQHNFLAVIQISDLGGAFAVSLLVAAVNVVVFEGLSRWATFRAFAGLPSAPRACCGNLVMQTVGVGVLLGAALGYGVWCLAYDEFDQGPRIALLQVDQDQRLRNRASQSIEARTRMRSAYIDLCAQAARLQPRPALIVWPETSCPDPWITAAPRVDLRRQSAQFQGEFDAGQRVVRRIGIQSKTHVLLGINTIVLDYDKQSKRYNSALLLDPLGEAVTRYDKLHRVPFGEYVPFRDQLPFMNRLAPYDYDYSIACGDGLTRFQLGAYHFGVLICYEDTDPFLARDFGVTTQDGSPVDFLLNISNDGWFDGSSEHEEHLAISRFRAIESRKAVGRAVNMGVTAVIDSNGRVLAPVKSTSAGQAEVWTIPAQAGALPIGDWAQYKQVDGILVVDMPIDRRGSLYAHWGDWLPATCWALVLGGWAWAWWRRRPAPVTA